MTLTLWAEWLRFRRNAGNAWIVATYCAVLLLSALWSAYGSVQHREAKAQEQQSSDRILDQARRAHRPAAAMQDPKAAGMQAFLLGRSNAGLAQLQAPPGLALSLSQYSAFNTSITVSVESRYVDGRRSDAVTNPLLAQIGTLDLAAIIALLLPLAAIGLCAGAIQEDRERGVWRTVCGQSAHPWRPYVAGLAMRLLALWVPAVAASALAMLLDCGLPALPTVAWWALGLAAYAACWAMLCATLSLLPISASAAVMSALAIWLISTFAIPAGIEAAAAARHPMPSRLVTIAELRDIQQDAEARMPALLDAWYARHPGSRPQQVSGHTWPVTFLPRFEHQDDRLRPLTRRFEQQRVAFARTLGNWAWLSPAMGMLQLADLLAGIDASRYAAYSAQVDQYEREWRSFFVPRVMSYRGLSAADYGGLPRFESLAPSNRRGVVVTLGLLALPALFGAVALLLGRRIIGKP